MIKIAFFHGLESPHISDKTEFLNKQFEVYAPKMNYRDSSLFEKVLRDVILFKPDFISGSSMGGWFAYCISTITGIPTILFNPAFSHRSLEVKTRVGKRNSKHHIVLGERDSVVDPLKSIEWLKSNGIDYRSINFEKIEHRIPIDIFKKHIDLVVFNSNS